jgi:hypothetical protein
MTKNPFDQFSKQFLEELLSPFGTIEITREVAGEPQFVDVYFIPNTQLLNAPSTLGLLGKMVQTPCLIEPFRNQPTPTEVRSCILKLLQVCSDLQRRARRETITVSEDNLPQLWILSSSASETLLNGFGAIQNLDWPEGAYFLPPFTRTRIVTINQLPQTDRTLWLRLLGKGKTQQQAIAEVLSLSPENPSRSSILRLLTNWKVNIEITGQIEPEEDLIMVLSQAYIEWEKQTEQRGLQQGERSVIMRQLTRRFGELAPEIQERVRSLSLEQLESLGEALLDFASIDELRSWLQSTNQ